MIAQTPPFWQRGGGKSSHILDQEGDSRGARAGSDQPHVIMGRMTDTAHPALKTPNRYIFSGALTPSSPRALRITVRMAAAM